VTAPYSGDRPATEMGCRVTVTDEDRAKAAELHERLTEALPHVLGPVALRFRETGDLTGYGQVLVDALLPVVTAWHKKDAERQVRARAAEELRLASDDLDDRDEAVEVALGGVDYVRDYLTARADALAADSGDSPA
jgi:hypothetical protein